MLNQYRLIQLQSSALQLLLLAEAKEYDAGWLDGGKKIYREGGRFASKGDSSNSSVDVGKFAQSLRENTEKQFASLPPEQQKQAKQELKSLNDNLNKFSDRIDKMTPQQQDQLRKFLTSSDMKKVRGEVAKLFDSVDKEAGKAFRQVDGKIDKELKEPGTFGKAMKRIQAIANNAIEGAKENPELVAGAALGAVFLAAGGAGAVALFTVPNLFGIGGVFGGLATLVSGGTGGAIASAFASGGLSQLGFAASAYLAIGGAMTLTQDATLLFSKEMRNEMKQMQAEYEQLVKEGFL